MIYWVTYTVKLVQGPFKIKLQEGSDITELNTPLCKT